MEESKKKEKIQQNNLDYEKIKSKEKRLSILVTILIIVVVILSISCVSLVINNNDNEKDNEVVEKEEDDKKDNDEEPNTDMLLEELNINTKEVSDLYELIKLKDYSNYGYTNNETFVSYDLESFLYSREKTLPLDLNESKQFGYFLGQFIEKYHFEYQKGDENQCEKSKITKSELEKVLYRLFGENYSIDDFSDPSNYFKYNETEAVYEFGGCGGDTSVLYLHTKLIKAEKKDNYIYLYEKIGIEVGPTDSYLSNNIENNKTEKPLNGKSIWEYEEDLSTFMYTFKKDKNGEYHLESMEYFDLK